MKIFVDAYLLNKEYQGTRTYISELYKQISLLDPNIKIVFGVIKLTDELINEFKNFSNIQFYQYKNKYRLIRMIYEIPNYLKNFDYAHFQYIIPLRKSTNKCKYINTIHDVLFLDYKKDFPLIYRLTRKILFKKSANASDILLTVSEYSKKQIVSHFSINSEDIVITPNGVNADFFSKYDKNIIQKEVYEKFNFTRYILYVSRIEPRKNQELLLKAYISDPKIVSNYDLVFIGKKSLESKSFFNTYHNLKNNIREKIHLIEQVDNKDLLLIYKAAECFIYPTKSEGFGIPPLEAGALKIPVLSSNTTAMKEFDFFKPYHFDPNNENEFYSIFPKFIKQLSMNDENLNNISDIIKEKFNWKHSASILLNTLNKYSY